MNSWMTILKQAYTQLILSKDATSGNSELYTWLSDQYGHINLGFVPPFMLFYFFPSLVTTDLVFSFGDGLHDTPLLVTLGLLLVWVVKEVANYFSQSKLLVTEVAKDEFMTTLTANVSVALCYFSYGTIMAYASTVSLTAFVATLLVYGGFCLSQSFYWLNLKINMDTSGLLNNYRVAVFNLDNMLKSSVDKDLVRVILDPQANTIRHYLMIGSTGAGKTELGNAIGCEYLYNNKKVLYITLTALIEQLHDVDDPYNPVPTWNDVDLIVVDDVQPSTQVNLQSRYLEMMNTSIPPWFCNIKNTQYLWLLGDSPDNSQLWLDGLTAGILNNVSTSTIKLAK